jgi:hypothetical protein
VKKFVSHLPIRVGGVFLFAMKSRAGIAADVTVGLLFDVTRGYAVVCGR